MDAAELTAIYELRLDLESAVAALAAERRTQEDVDVMEHILRRLEAALCCSSSSATDQEFHVRIAAASGNKYHLQLLQYQRTDLSNDAHRARTHATRRRTARTSASRARCDLRGHRIVDFPSIAGRSQEWALNHRHLAIGDEHDQLRTAPGRGHPSLPCPAAPGRA
ncbi:FadR/GntR family transcriptional regulator [Achromobacter denitrificans]|uniref:FadR/GntR family transcriptional regulator n=1 Tax=Achromobacter denitrificans TaxID=32002 RepID=UPI000B48AD56|nr:GntR family transcriptional regulator [Achromobacter denitrificans]